MFAIEKIVQWVWYNAYYFGGINCLKNLKLFLLHWNLKLQEESVRVHSLSMYAKFSEKLTYACISGGTK